MSKSSDSTISFSAPASIKEQLQEFADDNGLSVGAVIRMSVVQALRNGINLRAQPGSHLKDSIQKADEEYSTGKGTMEVAESESDVDDYFASLKK